MNLNRMVWKIANEVSQRMTKIHSQADSGRFDLEWIKKNIRNDEVLPNGEIASEQAMEFLDTLDKRLAEIIQLSNQYQEVE